MPAVVALHAEQHNADTLVLGIFSCAKTDGTAATVGIHEHIALVQIHAVDSEPIEQLGLLRVGLIKRGGGDVEFAAEQLVAHALGAIDDTSFLAEDGVAGTAVDILGDGDDMRIECRHGFKELLRMRQVTLGGHERNHDLVGTPTAADDGIAEQAQMLVLVKGGNVQALSFTRDAVKNLSGARCLDGAFGYGNDLVRAALKESRSGQRPLCREQREWQPYDESHAAQDICPGRPG